MRSLFIAAFCFNTLFSFGQKDSIEKAELTRNAYSIQNTMFGLYESRNYDSALLQLDRVLQIWTGLRDTLNEANLLKFRGLILGMKKRFAEGKSAIQRAIQLYSLKNKPWGVAVSQFDLAQVYEQESKLDSALYFDQLALNYWKAQQNAGRIIIINNHLVQVLGKGKRYKEAVAIQQETEPMLAGETVHYQQRLDHYFLSAILYEKLGQKAKAGKYRELYENQLTTLKQQNIAARPGHDGF